MKERIAINTENRAYSPAISFAAQMSPKNIKMISEQLRIMLTNMMEDIIFLRPWRALPANINNERPVMPKAIDFNTGASSVFWNKEYDNFSASINIEIEKNKLRRPANIITILIILFI